MTDGGRGIGRAIALALSAAGAYVAVLARSESELVETVAMIEQTGGRARAFAMDVTDASAVCTTMAAIERLLGPVDLLVNNAATLGPIGPFCETGVGEWWHAMDVNLRGPFFVPRPCFPQ